MKILFYDYETYYADDYSLSKMTTSEYIADERFHAHGMAVSIDDSPDEWIPHRHLRDFWNDVAPHVDAICAHNGRFDHAITARYFCDKRFFLLDTLSMARGAISTEYPDISMSLDALAKHYFPNTPHLHKQVGGLDPSKGQRELSPWLEKSLAAYAKQDNKAARAIFAKLMREDYPWQTELHNIHLTLAMSVYPVLRMDTMLAGKIAAREVQHKEEVAAQLCVTREELRSAERFAELLRAHGVVPPTKISPRTGMEAYAFAAKDLGMQALLSHDSVEVQVLAETRLGEKSAQLETRAARFARLPSPLPVPLGYAKAHTGRHGGEEYNLQNLGRGSELRACIVAPPGHKLVVSDLAQIEPRLTAWFSDEHWLLEAFREGRDVYCELASMIYGRDITAADETERFVGKTGILSCLYGVGAAKVTGSLESSGIKDAETLAPTIVKGTRGSCRKVVAVWKMLNDVALPAVAGIGPPVERKGLSFEKGRAVLPSGRSLHYPDLRVNDEGDWVYRVNKRRNKGGEWKKIYGAALLENLIQAMAFDVFMHHARQMDDEGIRPALLVHDEIGTVAVQWKAARVADRMMVIQATVPDWCRDLPTKGKAGIGVNYLECK